MPDRPEILRLAGAMADHAARRQAIVAENVANADTPGFRAGDLPRFGDAFDRGGMALGLRTTRPGHLAVTSDQPAAERIIDRTGEPAPNGNSVSVERELVKAAEIRQQHDMALAVYKGTLDLMRSAIGRAR